ncbi:MAG: hypothetical protein JJV98_09520 [Desulfosarcina sp.]|nr:hypothetical protein [Desulfobacterales bacterium]
MAALQRLLGCSQSDDCCAPRFTLRLALKHVPQPAGTFTLIRLQPSVRLALSHDGVPLISHLDVFFGSNSVQTKVALKSILLQRHLSMRR